MEEVTYQAQTLYVVFVFKGQTALMQSGYAVDIIDEKDITVYDALTKDSPRTKGE